MSKFKHTFYDLESLQLENLRYRGFEKKATKREILRHPRKSEFIYVSGGGQFARFGTFSESQGAFQDTSTLSSEKSTVHCGRSSRNN